MFKYFRIKFLRSAKYINNHVKATVKTVIMMLL